MEDLIYNPGKGRGKTGPKSDLPIISLSLKYNRIYVSRFLIKYFNLDVNGFELENVKGKWFLKIVEGQPAKLKVHEYAYYFVNSKLTKAFLISFPRKSKLKFLVDLKEDSLKQFSLTFYKEKPKTRKKKPFPFIPKKKVTPAVVVKATPRKRVSRTLPSEAREMLQAEKIMMLYRLTDFEGRIKTVQVLNAESLLSRKGISAV